ncbi:hypothetical protein OsJ_18939 [Oryza sativa Japonica Group]|uniref:Uncharacterized protein n=1 Tax=Oryza sativa subsp. japonica TaxID=39947 RepID=B9FJS5_ORYSJ|nr:hypothetical protein OsJ_18939 [Oryza sativa Japonica Group]
MESAVASAFLKAVMGRLFMALEKEYSKHKGLAQEAQSLLARPPHDRRRHGRPAPRHGEGRTTADARTAVARLHAEEMLDLAHDVEECVDRFLHRLTCRQHRGGAGAGASSSSLVRRMAHELSKVQSRSSFADEIQRLKTRVREAQQRIIRMKPTLDVLAGGGGGGGQLTGAAGTSSTAPSCRASRIPVGIAEPVEELLSMLDEVDGEPEQMRVISVVGFGGSGKTTLVKAVYDDPRAKDRFSRRAWVTVGSSPSPETSNGMKGILRAVFQQVLPKDAMDADGQHLETSLKEYLKDKSHGNGYVYQMNTLGEEDSKELAFPGFRSPELEQGSASLLGKCDGLPLALVSVSDYLKSSNEPTGELCAKLCRNLGSHLKEQDGHYSFSELRKVLLDNYDSFSGYPLSCLLYLGIFPNNRPLKKKVVIRRWLAEGYARTDSLRSEEDIADENFSKLIDRNIIQPVDTRNNSEVKTCKTHGIMHEFLLNKSLSQIFIAKSSRDHPRLGVNTNACHLSFHSGELTECVASDEELSRVRSLTVFGHAGDAICYVRRCKLIRVLDLQECSDLDDDHLKYICKLWHLKYLSFGSNISELPRSIDGLHCLETLDLRRTQIKFLPIEAIMLPHLAHLFGKFMLHEDDVKSVNKMSKLQKFFSSKKSNLQTLAGFITDESKGFLQHIGHMNKLRKVKIWFKHVEGSNNYIADLSRAIQEFTKAPIDRDTDRSLSLDSEECPENFLSSLDLETCSEGSKYALRSLKLNGELHKLPPFVNLLSGLTELCISSPMLTQVHLSTLINLNRLLYLKLVAYKLENFEIKHGAFPSLRRLCFVVKSVTSALPTIKHGALPNIISLQLLCQGPVGLSGIEIRHMKHLKEITINSGVVVQWEQAAKNHPNRPKVLFLRKVDPMESEERGRPCAIREQMKITVAQPTSSGDGLNSSLNKIRLSEPPSSRLEMPVRHMVDGH